MRRCGGDDEDAAASDDDDDDDDDGGSGGDDDVQNVIEAVQTVWKRDYSAFQADESDESCLDQLKKNNKSSQSPKGVLNVNFR